MSLPTPINRNEQYLNAIATGNTVDMPAKPITREEQYLDYIARNGGGDAGVSSVNGKTGAVTLDASDVGALPADTPIPSKTSDLDNDSGFVPADSALSTTSENALQNKVITSNILAIENVTGAKNLNIYPYYETTKTENGITFTDNGDGTITIGTGTASADTFFMYHESYENLRLSKNGQQYTLSGCPVGGGSSSYSLFFNYKIDDNTWGNAVYDNGDGVDISYSYTGSSSGGIYYGGIQIKSGTVISTPITFKPMIRPAGTDPTYVPYAMTNEQLTNRVHMESVLISSVTVAPDDGGYGIECPAVSGYSPICARLRLTGNDSVNVIMVTTPLYRETHGQWSLNLINYYTSSVTLTNCYVDIFYIKD